MSNKLFRWGKKATGCMLVVGSDIQQLSQSFAETNLIDALHVYHVVNDLNQEKIHIEKLHNQLTVVRINLIDQHALKKLLSHITSSKHQIELCIFQAYFSHAREMDILLSQEAEHEWNNNGLSAVSLSQVMIREMLMRQSGTMIFLGSQPQSSAYYDPLSQSSFAAIRALSQSLAREFHPKGIHVCYCMLEQWQGHREDFVNSVKKACLHLHQQPNSTWSQELSLGI
ncbi:oxidoreductase [Acinetobacter venetianus]|uniref:SDR family NAD(P)-dependent oxidoreductase n=1 Tax=Acinetobacter venetianus TaxID=52133 RepID=UPI0007757706|nr:SDR family NAD(P)-dependent oxidoreductase [Acinetobacter venetianus]KXO73472.1 oxidoreductase [Acinetobacter venetianus]